MQDHSIPWTKRAIEQAQWGALSGLAIGALTWWATGGREPLHRFDQWVALNGLVLTGGRLISALIQEWWHKRKQASSSP